MRQAVPFYDQSLQLLGQDLERQVASDSRVLINAENDGVVEYVDADKIQSNTISQRRKIC
jgi:DNA-directed RNA polymerase subunit beta